jgi:hypothetical protein
MALGVTGREVKIAFDKYGTNSWGVAASVTKGMYFSSDGGIKYNPMIVEDDAFGQYFMKQSDVGNITPTAPQLAANARYNDYSYIWDALAMGSPNAVTISSSVSGQVTSWKHIIDLAANLDGIGVTLAIDKVQYVEEVTSAKVHGFTFEDGENGVMRETWKITGNTTTNISSTNINSTVAGATFPTLANRIFKRQGVFRMNAQSGGSLVVADAVPAESIKFSYERTMDAPHVYGQDYVIEPADGGGFPSFELEVTYPRMTTIAANSLYAGLRTAQAWKADWTFTGALINSTDTYKALFQFPYIQVVEFEAPVSGANQVKPKAKFKARLADSAPTGMTGVTNPFRLTRWMVNSLAAF